MRPRRAFRSAAVLGLGTRRGGVASFGVLVTWAVGFILTIILFFLVQPLQCVYVAQVVAFFVYVRLENEGFPAQFRVREDTAEPGFANMALADVLMPVNMRSQRRFGVVRVEH